MIHRSKKENIEAAESTLQDLSEMRQIVDDFHALRWRVAKNPFIAYQRHMRGNGPAERTCFNELVNEAREVVSVLSKKKKKEEEA